MNEGFPKYERINLDKDIHSLFEEGNGFSCYPFRVVVHVQKNVEKPSCRLLISVSKKRFHHAFKRNRVKRLIREAWRKNKSPLYSVCSQNNVTIDVALIYTATIIHSYDEMYRKTEKTVKEIIKKYAFFASAAH